MTNHEPARPWKQAFAPRREALLLALDLGVCAGSLGVALHLRFNGDIPPQHLVPYLTCLPLLVIWRVLAASAFGLYDFRHRLTVLDHACGAAGLGVFGVGGGYAALAIYQLYYAPHTELSRLAGSIDVAILFAWFFVSRAAMLGWLHATRYRVRVLLVGDREACSELEEEIDRYAPSLVEVHGTVAASSAEESGAAEASIAQCEGIDQIILVQVDLPQERLRALLATCEQRARELYLYPDLNMSILANADMRSIAGLPLIALAPALEYSTYGVIKRILDLAAAALILTLTLPFTLAAVVGIKLTSPGPALFRQERLGLLGKPFTIYKFRTMRYEAERDSGPVLSIPEDERVTPLGGFLRKIRLDEVPQLWNVLCGEMSLVGPRPERKEFSDRFAQENPLYERRTMVRPGLTGLAQIHGRYDTDYTHKLRYDLTYINSVSLTTDLAILLATVRTVLTGRGAI